MIVGEDVVVIWSGVVVVVVGSVLVLVVVVGSTPYSLHTPPCKLYQPSLQVQYRYELLPTED